MNDETKQVIFVLVMFATWLTIMSAGIWVALHFIIKYW